VKSGGRTHPKRRKNKGGGGAGGGGGGEGGRERGSKGTYIDLSGSMSQSGSGV
jgi:hypothetical protein